jgi:hypothetical protein
MRFCRVTDLAFDRCRHRYVRPPAHQALQPIDEADRIDDWLYLPETLYAFMLIVIVSTGAGPYSLNAPFLGLMNKDIADTAFHRLFSSDAVARCQTAAIMIGPP